MSKELVDAGYERYDRMHLISFRPGASFVVDIGPLDGKSDVAPWVGVRDEGVEEALSRFLELPNGQSATAGTNVGYLLIGSYATWLSDADPERPLTAIAEARNFLEPLSVRQRIPEIFRFQGSRGPGHEMRLATIYHVLGDDSAADEWLAKGEAADCRYDDGVCEQFRRFQRNLLEDRRLRDRG